MAGEISDTARGIGSGADKTGVEVRPNVGTVDGDDQSRTGGHRVAARTDGERLTAKRRVRHDTVGIGSNSPSIPRLRRYGKMLPHLAIR